MIFAKSTLTLLSKTLAPGSKPRYETICKLMDALGVKLTVKAA